LRATGFTRQISRICAQLVVPLRTLHFRQKWCTPLTAKRLPTLVVA
jgi:hypothetical protein